MELKELFGEEALTYDDFNSRVVDKGLKLVDLTEGNYVSKEKYDALVSDFDKYKEENDVTKYADYEDLKAENAILKAEKTEIEEISKVKSAGIDDKFSKFVYAEVKSRVTDDKDFDTALAEYVNENPHFKVTPSNPNPVAVVVTSGVGLDTANDSVGASGEQALYDELNNIFGKGE